jgi:holo-[acyl-carrier protein] synthase
MIKGIGTDIVGIDRFQLWVENPGLIKRYFHPLEISELKTKIGLGYTASLAGRFAAKEAFGKALGSGLRGLRLPDIRVSTNSSGKPVFILEGTARDQAGMLGVCRCHLSISHDGGFALAFVVLEGEDQ